MGVDSVAAGRGTLDTVSPTFCCCDVLLTSPLLGSNLVFSHVRPEAIGKAVNSLRHKHVGERINILVARLCFRGIYFPQTGWRAWIKVVAQNRRTILSLLEKRLVLQDATA
jgi:hypothetical protein